MPAITRLTLVLSLTLLAIFADAAPTATEQRVVEAVDRNNADAVALLERVVNVNSGTMNLKGVKAVGEIFMAEFGKLEFNTRWVEAAPLIAPAI